MDTTTWENINATSETWPEKWNKTVVYADAKDREKAAHIRKISIKPQFFVLNLPSIPLLLFQLTDMFWKKKKTKKTFFWVLPRWTSYYLPATMYLPNLLAWVSLESTGRRWRLRAGAVTRTWRDGQVVGINSRGIQSLRWYFTCTASSAVSSSSDGL